MKYTEKKSFLKFAALLLIAAVIFPLLSGCGMSAVSKKNKLKSNLYYRLGVGFYQNGNYIKAMQEFIRAKMLYPYSAKNYNAIGIIYMKTARGNKAVKNFMQAVKINPQFSDAYYNLGLIYIKKKSYLKAKIFLKKALKNPFYNKPYESYTQLAKIYIAENKIKKAKKILTVSMLLDKNYFLAYYYMGKCMLLENNLPAGLYYFKKTLDANMFFIPAKYYKGLIYFKQKRYNKAKYIFSSVYDADKADKYGAESLKYIKKILILLNK